MSALQEIIVIPTLTLTQYKKGEAVGDLLIFPDACRHTGPTGTILGAKIVDTGLQAAVLTLALFSAAFTATPDHDPFTLTPTDQLNSIANIEFAASDYVGGDLVEIASLFNLNIPIVPIEPPIYGQLFLSFGNATWPAVDALKVMLTFD